MDCRYLLFFLLITQAAFSAVTCIGYTDSFDVRVLDAKYRPVPGAEVTIKYDRGSTFGETYFTTPPQLTNESGMVHFDIINQGTLTRKIDCKITVTGSAGGRTVTNTITALQHPNPVDVVLTDVYPVQFYVRDQYRVPLANATVTLNGTTRMTGEEGRLNYFLKKGNYSYFASYMDGSQPGTLSVSDDTSYEVLLAFYGISIEVLDDFGEPLQATLTILNTSLALENGYFENNRTFGEQIKYEINHDGNIREGVIEAASEPHITVVYDTHAPNFENITSEAADGRPRLVIKVTDPGQYASGVDFQSVKITYKVKPADEAAPWSTAVAFTTARDTVAAEFPEVPANSIVDFRAEIRDKAGNKAAIGGTFSTLVAQNTSQNQTNTHEEPQQVQEIPLIYIVGGAIVVILIAYAVIKIKRNG